MAEVLIAACGGAAVGGFFTILVWVLNRKASKADKQECRKDGIELGVQILLYDKIKNLSKKYIDAGHISPEDLEDLIRMHKIYHDNLNGNGFLDDMMEAVHALPKK